MPRRFRDTRFPSCPCRRHRRSLSTLAQGGMEPEMQPLFRCPIPTEMQPENFAPERRSRVYRSALGLPSFSAKGGSVMRSGGTVFEFVRRFISTTVLEILALRCATYSFKNRKNRLGHHIFFKIFAACFDLNFASHLLCGSTSNRLLFLFRMITEGMSAGGTAIDMHAEFQCGCRDQTTGGFLLAHFLIHMTHDFPVR